MRDDETKNWHNYLIIQVPKQEFSALKAKFDTQVPKLACWAMIRNGNPCVVFEYGGVISLSEAFSSGETLGEKLAVGDIVTVVLTDKPHDQLFSASEGSLKLNFNLDEVIVYVFTYTKEMEQTYEFYSQYAKLKDAKSAVSVKNKSKLSFR
jgi:hypothetical protein